MRINYLSYDDRLRKQALTQAPEAENMCRKNSIVSTNERSSVNSFNNGSNMRNQNDVAAINFEGKISEKIFKSKLFNDLLWGFENKTALAQNGVALVVAGGFRPATNILMANKEDRDDCYHAATHSISSALVGFGVTCSVMKPFTDAVKKFKNNPAKYLKPEMAGFYGLEELGPRKVQTSRMFKSTCKMTEMIPEIAIGVPKAMLTIALIPPILKYFFGIEKKKHDNKPAVAENVKAEVVKNEAKEAEIQKGEETNSPNFTGAKRSRGIFKELRVRARKLRMAYDKKVVESIAKNYYGATMQSKPMKWLGEKTIDMDAIQVCSIVNSAIISTMYTIRTLQNKDLKKERRNTLAVNDVLTFLLSTASALLLDNGLANRWSKVTHNYAATQLGMTPQALTEAIEKANELLGKGTIKNAEDYTRDVIKHKDLNFKIKGMGLVKSLLVFGMVYRYLVPVFVMKPANKIGAKLNKHLHEKEMQKELAEMNEKIEEKKEDEIRAKALKDIKELDDIDEIDD